MKAATRSKTLAKKQRRTRARDLATAYHEAGHAFVGWKLGERVKIATIEPNTRRGSDGYVISRSGRHNADLAYSRLSGQRIGEQHNAVVVLMAGEAAQRRHNPKSVRPWHAGGDRKEIADILTSMHERNEARQAYRYLEVRTKNFVEDRRHWPVISHLARELIKHRRMNGEQVVAAIIEGNRIRNEKWKSETRTSSRWLTKFL